MRLIACLVLLFALLPSANAGDWPEKLREGVYAGCLLDAPDRDIKPQSVDLFCRCFTISIEKIWPLRDFGEVLAAMDEPDDSPTNRQLAGVVKGCRP